MAKASSSSSSGWVSSTFDCFQKPLSCSENSKRSHDVRKRKAAQAAHTHVGLGAWVDKFAPSEKGDLAVHKRKVEQVEDWLKEALSQLHNRRGKCPILLLTGPSGCGKTATVRVLASHLALSVHEWRNSSQYVAYRGHHADKELLYEEQQTPSFSSFLVRASRYSDLCEDEGSGRLVLVEDLPNLFFRDPTNLHSVLRQYAGLGRSPTVFILSDSSRREMSSSKLFPKELAQELGIHEISFNPITALAINKVLSKILATEKEALGSQVRSVSKAEVSFLSESSRGDIRAAINSLQFAATPNIPKVPKGCRPSESAKRPAAPATKEEIQNGKDSALLLFHALGKILYCKRDESKQGPKLPAHLSGLERSPLLENPESIVDRTGMTGESFNLFLHQNFLEFFGEAETASAASDCLSTADCLRPSFEDQSRENEYGSSVGARGLMFCLSSKNAQQTSGSRKWKPLRKPVWYDTNRICQKNLSSCQDEFKESIMSSGQDLFVTSIPYMSKILPPCASSRRHLVQELTRFSNGTDKRLESSEVLEEEEDYFQRPVFSTNHSEPISISSNEDNVQIEDFDD